VVVESAKLGLRVVAWVAAERQSPRAPTLGLRDEAPKREDNCQELPRVYSWLWSMMRLESHHSSLLARWAKCTDYPLQVVPLVFALPRCGGDVGRRLPSPWPPLGLVDLSDTGYLRTYYSNLSLPFTVLNSLIIPPY